MPRPVKWRTTTLAALLLPVASLGDDWEPLISLEGHQYTVDRATIQRSQRGDNKAPAVGIWVRREDGLTFQVWVDCAARWSSTYYPPPNGWDAWAPIPPESREWAVWEYLCRKKAKTVNQPH